MAWPTYKVTDKRDGAEYDMPWQDVGRQPTIDEVRAFIDTKKNPSIWDRANTPLSDIPSRIGRGAAEPLYNWGEQNAKTSPWLSSISRGAGAFTEALGDIGTQVLSPMGLVSTLAAPGAGAAGRAGIAPLATGLRGAAYGAGAAQVGHGASEVAASKDWAGALPGLTEIGLGALGARQARGAGVIPKPAPKIPDMQPGGVRFPPGPKTNPMGEPFIDADVIHTGEIVPPGARIPERGAPFVNELPPRDMGLPPARPPLELPPSSLDPRGLPVSPKAAKFEPRPEIDPDLYYAGRRGVSSEIDDVTDFGLRAKTPEEEAFNALVPERFKPTETLESMSDEGLRSTAPFDYVPETGRAQQGYYPPNPIRQKLTPREMGRMPKKPTPNPDDTLNLGESTPTTSPRSRKFSDEAWDTLRSIFDRASSGDEGGFAKLDLLLPEGIEDMITKGSASVKSVMEKLKGMKSLDDVKATVGKVKEALPDYDPFSGITRSGWAYLDNAGPAGKKLTRLLSRARVDIEAEATKAGFEGKLGSQIHDRYGDEIKGLLEQIEDPARRTQAQKIIDTQLGRSPAAKKEFRTGVDALKKFQAVTKLSQFVISNTQGLGANFARGNTKAATQAIIDTIFDAKNSLKTARESGALRSVDEELATDVVSKFANKAYGIDWSERKLRTMSALTGRATAKELFETLQSNPGNKRALKRLDDLLLEDDIPALLRQGELTEKQLNRAAGRMAELTQGRAESIDLPPLWTGHPLADMVTQFKRYAFAQGRNMKLSFDADPWRTGAAIAIAFPALGEVVGDVKEGIKGAVHGAWNGEDISDSVMEAIAGRGEGLERYFNDLSQSWALGLFKDLYDASKRGGQGIAEWVGGPTVSDVSETGSALYEGYEEGNWNPLKRKAARTIPVVGNPIAGEIKGSYSGRQRRRARERRPSRGR